MGSAFLAKSLGHTVAAWRLGMSLVPILHIQGNLAVALRVLAVATDAAEQEDDQVKLSKALNNIGLTLPDFTAALDDFVLHSIQEGREVSHSTCGRRIYNYASAAVFVAVGACVLASGLPVWSHRSSWQS